MVQTHLQNCDNQPECVQVYLRETPTSYVVYRPKGINNGTLKFQYSKFFGPTIQGEGRVIGRKTMFVRTAGCDYRCSWCDSAFTWDGSAKEDIKLMTAEEIYNQLKKSAVTVLITLRYLEVTQH